MSQAQQQLAAQQIQIQLVSTIINEHCVEVHKKSEMFLSNQEQLKNNSIIKNNELSDSIKLQLETYQQNVIKKNAEANKLIQNQAELVEKVYNDLLII